jgi:hypothetical protein
VTLGTGGIRVEADPVVPERQHDVAALLADRDPHVPRLRVLEGVHHALPGDVVHEQSDRRRQVDVRDVAMEAHRRVPTHLVRERLECLGEALRAERRPMQVSDQGSDAIGRLLLRFADLLQLRADVRDLPLLEELPGNVDLYRQSEQHLGKVVMEVAGDLETFVRRSSGITVERTRQTWPQDRRTSGTERRAMTRELTSTTQY